MGRVGPVNGQAGPCRSAGGEAFRSSGRHLAAACAAAAGGPHRCIRVMAAPRIAAIGCRARRVAATLTAASSTTTAGLSAAVRVVGVRAAGTGALICAGARAGHACRRRRRRGRLQLCREEGSAAGAADSTDSDPRHRNVLWRPSGPLCGLTAGACPISGTAGAGPGLMIPVPRRSPACGTRLPVTRPGPADRLLGAPGFSTGPCPDSGEPTCVTGGVRARGGRYADGLAAAGTHHA